MARSAPTQTTDEGLSSFWWVLLLTGLFWLLISLIVLRFDDQSITTVGALMGVVFLMAGASELLVATLVKTWKVFNYAMGALLVLGAIWSFTQPEESFWALASVLGFLFVFKGTLDILVAVASKPLNELWWLGLVIGLAEVLLGFWASQQLDPARAQLIFLWVGIGALLRGINQIVLSFQLKALAD
jgi:uncharacterized membrane protein HdeD (DUF308 family)